MRQGKIAISVSLVAFTTISGVLVYGSFHASERMKTLEFQSSIGLAVPSDYIKRINRILERIRNEDYWLGYAPWNRLMVLRFLASSIGWLVRTYPEDVAFRSDALRQLSDFYKTADSDTIRSSFSESGTKVSFGIIYQSWRLQILEELMKLEPSYRNEFFSECDKIADILVKSPRFTAESYPEWGWYVDNADAYHALWSADAMLAAQWESKRYAPLIASWTGELAAHIGKSGLTLAEAYRPWNSDLENQVRWSATGWLLWTLHDIDPNLAEKFFHMYKREFLDSYGWYAFIRDIPRNERKINDIFDGPKLWPFSSSATILSVPIFGIFDADIRIALLRSFDTLLMAPSYNSDNPDWFFWWSLLLDVLRLWAEVSVDHS